jgi:hypothetical protein
MEFGIFVRFGTDSVEGLIPVAQIPASLSQNLSENFKIGGKITAKIIEISNGKVANRIELWVFCHVIQACISAICDPFPPIANQTLKISERFKFKILMILLKRVKNFDCVINAVRLHNTKMNLGEITKRQR